MKRIILRGQAIYLLISLVLIIIFTVLLTACGGVSHEGCGVTCAAPPTQPQVTATPGEGQASISWDAVNGATYNIYWSTSTGVTKTTGTKISNVTSPYLHTGLTNGTTYYYIVTIVMSCVCYDECKGCLDDGDEISSNQASATPSLALPAPTSVGAAALNGAVILGWGAVSNATSYNIYWSNIPGVTKATGTKLSDVICPYSHLGLTNDTTYYYVITAVNSYGESNESNQVSAMPSVDACSGGCGGGCGAGGGEPQPPPFL